MNAMYDDPLQCKYVPNKSKICVEWQTQAIAPQGVLCVLLSTSSWLFSQI